MGSFVTEEQHQPYAMMGSCLAQTPPAPDPNISSTESRLGQGVILPGLFLWTHSAASFISSVHLHTLQKHCKCTHHIAQHSAYGNRMRMEAQVTVIPFPRGWAWLPLKINHKEIRTYWRNKKLEPVFVNRSLRKTPELGFKPGPRDIRTFCFVFI